MKLLSILAVLAVATIVVASRQTPAQYTEAAVDRDQNVLTGGPITGITLQDLSPAMKQTLKDRVPHAEIALIEKTNRAGHVVYVFTFTDSSDTPKLTMSEDGTVLPTSTKDKS